MRWFSSLAIASLLAGCPRPRVQPPATHGQLEEAPAKDLAALPASPDARDDAGTDADRRLADLAPRVVELDGARLDVVGTDGEGNPVVEASAPGPVLDRGNREFAAGNLAGAAAAYRELLRDFPGSELAPVALFNLGLVSESKDDARGAIAAYRELAAEYPRSRESIDGTIRAAALLAELRAWTDASSLLAQLLERSDLSSEIRLEAQARKGYCELSAGAIDDAEATLLGAIATWRRASRVEDPYYIAMAHFYLGDVDRLRFQASPFRSGQEELVTDVSARRALVLAAYAHWRDALVLKDAHWSLAAGFRMSEVFYEYWHAVVTAPYPDGMDPEVRPTYVTELRARMRENLLKALDGHRANLGLAAAFGVSNQWSEASRTRSLELMTLVERDARGDLAVP